MIPNGIKSTAQINKVQNISKTDFRLKSCWRTNDITSSRTSWLKVSSWTFLKNAIKMINWILIKIAEIHMTCNTLKKLNMHTKRRNASVLNGILMKRLSCEFDIQRLAISNLSLSQSINARQKHEDLQTSCPLNAMKMKERISVLNLATKTQSFKNSTRIFLSSFRLIRSYSLLRLSSMMSKRIQLNF